jgi:iron complex transport system substrate-binding protein
MRPVYFFSALLGLLFLAVQACSAAPIFIKDDLGRTIRLDHAPQRIVSLEPSVTEVLYAVGAGDKIVADDLYSDYPAAAKLKVHVNGVGPSRELLLGLKPDLVILFDQTFTIQKADNWQRMYGVPVYVTNAGTYRGVEADIQHLGAFAGNKQLTDAVIAAMDHAVNLVTRAVANRPKRKAFVVIWNTPLMTAGRGTFI